MYSTESEQIGAALNIEATSAVAMVSSMYATLGLPSKDRANRHTRALQRHNRIRQIMQHPEVKPPRANHHKETPAAKKEEKAPRVILPVPNKVEQQMSQLLPRELELLMALAEFGESSPTVSELIEARSPRLEKYLSATMESLWSKIGLYRPAGATDKDWGVYRQKILRDILGLTG